MLSNHLSARPAFFYFLFSLRIFCYHGYSHTTHQLTSRYYVFSTRVHWFSKFFYLTFIQLKMITLQLAYNRRAKLIFIIIRFIEVASCVLRVWKPSIVCQTIPSSLRALCPWGSWWHSKTIKRPLIRKEDYFFPHYSGHKYIWFTCAARTTIQLSLQRSSFELVHSPELLVWLLFTQCVYITNYHRSF